MLATKKISKELTHALRHNENIKSNDILANALGVIETDQVELSSELERLIACYGPDTTVNELIDMATFEEPKPVEWGKVFSKFAFWR